MSADKKNTAYALQDSVFKSDFSGLNKTPFGDKGMGKIANNVRQVQFKTPDSNSSATFGSKAIFKMGKRQNFIGCTHLVWTISALGGAATSPRLVDFAGYRSIGKMVFFYQQKDIQTLWWNTFHPFHELEMDTEDAAAVEFLVLGGISQANRVTAATAPQTAYVKLPFFYTGHPSKYLLSDALSHEPEIEWDIPSLGDLTQSDNATTPTGTISDIKLRIETYHVDEIERDYHIDRTLTDTGVVSYFPDFEYLLNQTPSGSGTTRTLNISGIRGSVLTVRFVLRNPTNITTPGTATNLPTTYVTLSRWRIVDDGGMEVTNWQTHTENLYIENNLYNSGTVGTAIYGFASSFKPEDVLNSTGHDSYSNFSQPTIEMEFASDPGSLSIDVFTKSRNTTQMVKGDLIRNFR